MIVVGGYPVVWSSADARGILAPKIHSALALSVPVSAHAIRAVSGKVEMPAGHPSSRTTLLSTRPLFLARGVRQLRQSWKLG